MIHCRPQVISDVLNNPGIGFMTFHRFNGHSWIPRTAPDVRTFLPGDSLLDGTLKLPADLPRGHLAVELGISPAEMMP